jgi:phospholipid/cholesterol/gamma-HCH transport system substrate-binding protein
MEKMKTNRPVVVGIFVVLGIAILVAMVFTLGEQKKTFVKTFTLNAVFNDVSGLLPGANVLFSGVKVGTIKKISFYGDSQVLVTMNIEGAVESHIHKDAKVKIGSDGLIGNKLVVIYGGTRTMPAVRKGDFLRVESGLNTDEMLATLQANNKNLLDITNTFKSISQKIDKGNGPIATLLNDQNISRKLNSSIDNLQTTMANFNTVSASSKNVLADVSEFSGKLNRRGNSINDLVADTTMYRNIRATINELKTASNSIERFSASLKTVSNRLNQKNSPVGVLLNDSTSASSLKVTLQNLETSSQKLDENLEALQHNFLLRGFFRKKEKAKEKEAKEQQKQLEN